MFTRSIGDFELKHNFAAEFFNGLVPEDKELPPVRSTDRTDPTHSRRGKDCALIYPGWRAHMWPWC
jgi:hypothetical protein